MECSNPACDSKTFTVRVDRKHFDPRLPMMPVILNCSKCRKQAKAWVVNPQLKDILGNLQVLLRGQKAIFEQLEALTTREEDRKGFFATLRSKLRP